jgi:predicted RNase H-like nuclease (RuvC/YqgF family)
MQELELLSNKLDTLLKKYAALQAENKGLNETVNAQQKSIEQLNSKLAAMEERVAVAHIGKATGDDTEREALRKQLDGVIGEIDKILTTIND